MGKANISFLLMFLVLISGIAYAQTRGVSAPRDIPIEELVREGYRRLEGALCFSSPNRSISAAQIDQLKMVAKKDGLQWDFECLHSGSSWGVYAGMDIPEELLSLPGGRLERQTRFRNVLPVYTFMLAIILLFSWAMGMGEDSRRGDDC